jgi:hypothetical protein
VRWIGILGIFAVIAANSADAQDATCLRQFEEADAADGAPAQGEQLLLTDNRCDAMKSEELRAPLMRIPQEDENPVELSSSRPTVSRPFRCSTCRRCATIRRSISAMSRRSTASCRQRRQKGRWDAPSQDTLQLLTPIKTERHATIHA